MKWEEYEEIASSLVEWLQAVTDMMLDRNFPATYNELKVITAPNEPDRSFVYLSTVFELS